MVRTGLWVELQAIAWFIVALGLASLLGDRTVALVLMIVFELVVSPILLLIGKAGGLPVLTDLQRAGLDLAVDHLEPSALGFVLPGIVGAGPGKVDIASTLPSEPKFLAVIVIAAWLVGWTTLGARRMMTRDV